MLKPILVGEAPSLQGDGRPFTGPSGDRLQALLGLKTYDELADALDMINLFGVPQPAWDTFDRQYARNRARHLLAEWRERDPDTILDVILAGRRVMRAFGVDHLPWFGFKNCGGVVLWSFPHPSGLNHFWNSPEDVIHSSNFLKARVNAHRTHHPSEHISLDPDQPQASAK